MTIAYSTSWTHIPTPEWAQHLGELGDVDEETARFIMRRSIYGLLQAADEASDVPAKEGLWINAKLMLDCIASGIPEALTSRVDTFLKSFDTLFQNEHTAREQRTRSGSR